MTALPTTAPPRPSVPPTAGSGRFDRWGPTSYLKLCEVADCLSISRATLCRMRQEGRLLDPTIEIDRLLRWLRAEVDKWAECGCPPADEWRKLRRRWFGDSESGAA
jgi:predicted DNA-binding transcriptional regulator AlpA